MVHWAVNQLVAVLRPPTSGGDAIDWERIRLERSVTFPADYQSFVEVYGGGFIDDYLDIFTPPVESSVYGQILAEVTLTPGLRHPDGYPFYPDSGGILRWGADSSGDDAFWHCENDDPDEWTILVRKRNHGPNEEAWKSFNGGMVEFLLAIIRDGYPSPFSCPGIPSSSSRFTSWRDEE